MIPVSKLIVTLMGRPQIVLDGEPVSLPFKQAEALLYYLLMEGSVSRAKIADIIWGDRGDEKKVKSSMRNAIYVLRKTFGHDFLQESQKSVIGINPEYEVDVDIKRVSGQPGENYTGEFLEEFYLKDNEYYNDWVMHTRQRLGRVGQEQLKQEMVRTFTQKQWEQCEEICQRLLKVDEFDESVYCCLMEIYRAREEYSKATSLYAQLKKLFDEELFQEPGREATMLMESIRDLRNQKVSELIAQKSLLERSFEPDDHVFFGRETEIDCVLDAMGRFEEGRPTQSLVAIGEAGIGKTSLLEQALLRWSKRDNVRCIGTRCYRAEEAYALKPWQPIFEQLIQHTDGRDQIFLEAVSNVFPFLRKSEGTPMDQDEIATVRYNNSERSIAHMLIQLAQKQKLVLFFDDLQWADNLTISLIQDVMTSGKNQNILFLFTCRTERNPYIDGFLENMAVSGLMKKIQLERFDYDQTIQLAETLLPEGLPSEELRQRFYRETEGSPFFIIETANSIKHNGSMTDITPNIRDSIYSRIMMLSPDCRNILNLLSVFFDGVTFDLLLELSNREDYELADILEVLIARQLIRELPFPDGIKFQFTHQKILEYVYGELSLTKKQILHNKVACCLEQKLKDNDSDLPMYSKLMYHFQRSRNQKKYLQYYIKYVYSYLNRSHEYYPIMVSCDSESYAEAPDVASADSESISHIIHDISELVERYMGEFDEGDCQGFLSDYYHMMGRYHIRKVQYEKGDDYIQRLIGLNKGRDSERCRTNMIKANRQLICIYIDRYEPENMKRIILESFELLKGMNKPEEEAIWMRLYGLCDIMTGELDSGEKYLEQAISIFEHSSEKERYLYNLAACYAWLGEAERHRMHYARAMEYYETAISICKDNYLISGSATFYTYAGQAALDGGDLEAAESYLTQAVRQFASVELMWGRGVANGYYGMLCVKQGRYPEAFEYLTRAEVCAAQLESDYEIGMIKRMFAQITFQMRTDEKLKSVFGGYLDKEVDNYIRHAEQALEGVYSPVDREYLRQLKQKNREDKLSPAKQ